MKVSGNLLPWWCSLLPLIVFIDFEYLRVGIHETMIKLMTEKPFDNVWLVYSD
jgi:hypothetical protein